MAPRHRSARDILSPTEQMVDGGLFLLLSFPAGPRYPAVSEGGRLITQAAIDKKTRQRWLLVIVCGAAFAVPILAHTKDLTTWSHQLEHDSDFKVRLSAAMRLGRLGDRRAVLVLSRALADEVATVRIIAASALGKLVDKEVPARERQQALAALRRVAASDADHRAREAAKTAIVAVEFVERIAKPRSPKNAVFVQVEPFSDASGSLTGEQLEDLTATGRDAVLAADETFLVEWPGGGKPSAKQLKRAKARAIIVMTSMTAMDVTVTGRRAQVECKANVILATYPQKAARAFVDGKAKLETDNRPAAIERAKSRCATDLTKHLLGNQLVADLRTAAR